MNEIELKPCPFCGGKARKFSGFIAGVTMIVCNNCRAKVSFSGKEQEQETVNAWDRRADNG